MAKSGLRCPVCGISMLEGASECLNGHLHTLMCQNASLIVATSEVAMHVLESSKAETDKIESK